MARRTDWLLGRTEKQKARRREALAEFREQRERSKAERAGKDKYESVKTVASVATVLALVGVVLYLFDVIGDWGVNFGILFVLAAGLWWARSSRRSSTSGERRMKRTPALLLAATLAVAFAACDDTEVDLSPTDSGIEGVPIPASAEAHPDIDDAWIVEGISYDELVAWYLREQMPEGEDFGEWEWCDTGGGATIHAHIYARGEREILAVSLPPADPPSVLIGMDESGPC